MLVGGALSYSRYTAWMLAGFANMTNAATTAGSCKNILDRCYASLDVFTAITAAYKLDGCDAPGRDIKGHYRIYLSVFKHQGLRMLL